MTTVSIRARPATHDDLKEGQVLLLPIWNERGPGHQAVTIRKNNQRGLWVHGTGSISHCVPDFFPENCFVPAP